MAMRTSNAAAARLKRPSISNKLLLYPAAVLSPASEGIPYLLGTPAGACKFAEWVVSQFLSPL